MLYTYDKVKLTFELNNTHTCYVCKFRYTNQVMFQLRLCRTSSEQVDIALTRHKMMYLIRIEATRT